MSKTLTKLSFNSRTQSTNFPRLDMTSSEFKEAIFNPEPYSRYTLFNAPKHMKSFSLINSIVPESELYFDNEIIAKYREKQLDNEFRRDKAVIKAQKIKKFSEKKRDSPLFKLNEQLILEDIDNWEREKIQGTSIFRIAKYK